MAGVNRIVLVRCIDEGFPLFGVGAKGTAPLGRKRSVSLSGSWSLLQKIIVQESSLTICNYCNNI